MTPEEIQRMSSLRAENTRLHNEISRLQHEKSQVHEENNRLNDDIERATRTTTELNTNLLNQKALVWESAQLRQKLQRAKAENRVLKYRNSGDALFDPLRATTHFLPLELQEMIASEVLRLDEPATCEDTRKFFTPSPTVANGVMISRLSRLQYLPTFLRCNSLTTHAALRTTQLEMQYKQEFEQELEPRKLIRSVELPMHPHELTDPTNRGCPVLSESLEVMGKLKNLRHLKIRITMRSSDDAYKTSDPRVLLSSSGCLKAFRGLTALKFFEAHTVIDRSNFANDDPEMKRAWLKKAVLTIHQVMKEHCPQCIFICPDFELQKPECDEITAKTS